jgi:hypothetical protein
LASWFAKFSGFVDLGRVGGPSDSFLEQMRELGTFRADGATTVTFGDDHLKATASHDSTITADMHWFGSGAVTFEATMFDQISPSSVESVLGVFFTLNETLPYRVSGRLNHSGNAVAEIGLDRRDGTMASPFFLGGPGGQLTRSGFLPSGSYLFAAVSLASGVGFGDSSWDFDFSLGDAPPVPEPTSLALIGIGLLSAVVTRKRKNARRALDGPAHG